MAVIKCFLSPFDLNWVVQPELGFSYFLSRQLRQSRRDKSLLVVNSAHSKAKVLKFNRRSTYGRPLDPFYSSEEELEEEDEDDDDEDEDDDYWSTDDDLSEPADLVEGRSFKPARKTGSAEISGINLNDKIDSKLSSNLSSVPQQSISREQHMRESDKNRYPKLQEEIDVDEKWFPLLDYLSSFGLKESHFIQMYERHMPLFQVNVSNARERLEYLFSVGVKQRDIKRILLRQPQILEYTVENNLKPHVSFLMNLGIPSSKFGQIIAVAPSFFSYSVENSLKPTIRYLVEEVGINEKDLGKVVGLSPQILVQRIDVSWNNRYIFLSRELGASKDSVVKMVTKHPQLLHYSIDDGLLPRINFLRSIGMHNSDILKVLTSLTQVLSLSLNDNLKPKYKYLVNELRNEVKSLTKYPMYLTLSLDQRIRPRHRFLVALKRAPKGPFPLSYLLPTDKCFCEQWAGTTVDNYLAFRQQLLLKDLSKKYERQ